MSGPMFSDSQFLSFSSDLWFSRTPLPWNPVVYCLVAAISAIGYWLVLELTFEVYLTFKRHDGLYFWSIIVSIWGVALRSIGWTVQMFAPDANKYFCTTFLVVGVSAMVTGFSFVLYSRLHLVIRDRRILRAVFIVIVFDGIAFLLPLAVSQFGLDSHNPYPYISLALPAERLYAVGNFIQESMIGCLYIWTARKTVLRGFVAQRHKTIAVLIGAQILVILLDIPTVVLAWPWPNMGAMVIILGTLHPTIYAIKVKIELVVLNQLVHIVRDGIGNGIPPTYAAECRNSPPDNKKSRVSASRIKKVVLSAVLRVGGSSRGELVGA